MHNSQHQEADIIDYTFDIGSESTQAMEGYMY